MTAVSDIISDFVIGCFITYIVAMVVYFQSNGSYSVISMSLNSIL